MGEHGVTNTMRADVYCEGRPWSDRLSVYLRPIIGQQDTPDNIPHCCILQRQLKPTVDFDLLADWLHACDQEHNHPDATHSSLTRHPNGLRFIDVRNRCIVEVRRDVKYAALSYTWGNHDRFCLTKGNLQRLKNANSLRNEHSKLGATTLDSLIVCEKLNIPYLWVDALCIVQDDMDNELGKADQIRHMDQVYAKSYITLVAASTRDGDSGDAGLSRVSVGMPATMPSITVDGVTFAILFERLKQSLGANFASSVWHTRGW